MVNAYTIGMSSQAVHKRRLKVRILAIEYLGGKCMRCGLSGNSSIYDFHHRDPEKKEFQISSGNTSSWEKVKKEVDKCDLLCANCHREIHYKSQEIEKDIINHLNDPPIPEKICNTCKKPTSTRYSNCIECGRKAREKIKWPTTESLIDLVEKFGYSETGRQLKVSDVAVKKRIKNHSRIR